MHRCEAIPCTKQVEDRLAMCLRHWRMVPHALRQAIWENYVQGQSAGTATSAYLDALHAAVNAVRALEGRRPVPR